MPLKTLVQGVVRTAQIVTYILTTLFGIWLLICSFDTAIPVKDFKITLKDTPPGEEVETVYVFHRLRQCALKSTTNITDSAGNLVSSQNAERLVNGNLGPAKRTLKFPIDETAVPGLAKFNLYLSWECPYNIMHSMVKPITAEYEATFTITKHE